LCQRPGKLSARAIDIPPAALPYGDSETPVAKLSAKCIGSIVS
jgi:hypothetical protein